LHASLCNDRGLFAAAIACLKNCLQASIRRINLSPTYRLSEASTASLALLPAYICTPAIYWGNATLSRMNFQVGLDTQNPSAVLGRHVKKRRRPVVPLLFAFCGRLIP